MGFLRTPSAVQGCDVLLITSSEDLTHSSPPDISGIHVHRNKYALWPRGTFKPERKGDSTKPTFFPSSRGISELVLAAFGPRKSANIRPNRANVSNRQGR